MNKSDWIKNQTQVVIPKLWSMIAGTQQKTAELRVGEVRVGGSNMPNNTFAVSKEELAAMLANPFLTVESYPSGNNFEVAYYYPDMFHYQGVAKAGYLSPQTVKFLNSINKAAAKKDVALQTSTNRRIMSELLENLFSRWHGQRITSVRDLARLMIEFVSIHPYAEFNGRTTRMYAHLALYESAVGEIGSVPLPHEYISDFDTIIPTRKYGGFMEIASPVISKLMRDLQKEMIVASASHAAPNYFALPGWTDLTTSLRIFGLKGSIQWTSADLSLIEKRMFTQLLDKNIGPDWGKTLPTK